MEKLAMLHALSKDAIKNAIETRQWIDDTRLTRLMIRKLTEFAEKMPDSPAPER